MGILEWSKAVTAQKIAGPRVIEIMPRSGGIVDNGEFSPREYPKAPAPDRIGGGGQKEADVNSIKWIKTIAAHVICAVRGHVPSPMPCDDKRWAIFYCGRCKEMVADMTQAGVRGLWAQDADGDMAKTKVLAQGMAQAFMNGIDRILLDSLQEAASAPVNPQIAQIGPDYLRPSAQSADKRGRP
jgi:hypothetical protein